MEFSLSELNNVLGDIKNLNKGKRDFLNFKNISIDSRTLSKNDLFIDIKGKSDSNLIQSGKNKGVFHIPAFAVNVLFYCGERFL